MLQQAFKNYAKEYDRHFTNSLIGKAQRNIVHKHLQSILKNVTSILEVNCGTGEDAVIFTNQGKKIIATDISPQMIQVAMSKNNKIDFRVCDATAIDTLEGSFDMVFSNFGGLNCIDKNQLTSFSEAANKKLNQNGLLALVFISSECVWEKYYFKLKGKEIRRNQKTAIATIDNNSFATYYYSPKELEDIFNPFFKLVHLKPIGLFVPPSYMESKMVKNKWIFKFLSALDYLFLNSTKLANKADHFYLVFKKK